MATTASTYYLGTRFRVTAAFTGTTGGAMNPSDVYFAIKTPAGAVTVSTYSGTSTAITNAAVGSYYAEHSSTAAGYYAWRWHSTGTLTAATEGKTYILKQTVAT